MSAIRDQVSGVLSPLAMPLDDLERAIIQDFVNGRQTDLAARAMGMAEWSYIDKLTHAMARLERVGLGHLALPEADPDAAFSSEKSLSEIRGELLESVANERAIAMAKARSADRRARRRARGRHEEWWPG